MKQKTRINTKKFIFAVALIILLIAIILLCTTKEEENDIKKLSEVQYSLNISGLNIDTSKTLSNEPNAPQLGAGMIPIKYEDGYWKITEATDSDWYDYSKGKLATVMLSDGYYKTEPKQGIDENRLAENNIGASVAKIEDVGTIFVWIPRLVYTETEIKYLIGLSIVETLEYSLPTCFTYKIKNQQDLAFSGLWVQQTPDNTKDLTITKMNEMKLEENEYGLIKNEIVENINGVANKITKRLQDGKSADQQQVKNIENTNRLMIRIVNTNKKTPIIVRTRVADKTAYIDAIYSEYGIDRIISVDTGATLSVTKNATMPVPENGGYTFAVIDKQGNVKTYEVDENGNTVEHSTVPIESILKDGYQVDKNNALVKGVIDEKKVSALDETWYNYAEQKWANIVTRNNASESYFVWIPRYVYQLDNENEVSTVTFVNTENVDTKGNEMDLEEWTLPEAFIWKDDDGEDIQLSGFWAAKYGLAQATKFNLTANVVGGINKIRVNNIKDETNITGRTYDLYLYKSGENNTTVKKGDTLEEIEKTKVKKGDELRFIQNITSHVFEDLEIGDYEIRIVLNDSTGKYRGEEWFTATVIDTAVKANLPDLTGFRVNTTYIVTYTDANDANTMEASIPISEILEDGYIVDENTNALVKGKIDENKVKAKLQRENEVWYDYNAQKWANIVTRNAGGESYFIWIPRYIYKLDYIDQVSEIQFVGTDIFGDKVQEEWLLPESFTWKNDEGEEVQLPGFWTAKYGLANKTTFNITSDVIGGANKIRISSVKDGSGQGFKYRFYLYEANKVKEYFAEPEAEMNAEDISNDHDCTGKRYVRYSEGLTDVIYYGLKEGLYDLRIVAYDSRGYYRGEKWFNDIAVIETGNANEIIKPGITESIQTGFNKDVTYYVTYDEAGGEILTPITSAPPSNWYDYNNQKWANIVVKGNGKTAYFVYIPRYIYKLDNVRQESEIKFVGKDVYGDKIPEGWIMPEGFTWKDNNGNPIQLPGFWVAKYGLSQ